MAACEDAPTAGQKSGGNLVCCIRLSQYSISSSKPGRYSRGERKGAFGTHVGRSELDARSNTSLTRVLAQPVERHGATSIAGAPRSAKG